MKAKCLIGGVYDKNSKKYIKFPQPFFPFIKGKTYKCKIVHSYIGYSMLLTLGEDSKWWGYPESFKLIEGKEGKKISGEELLKFQSEIDKNYWK